MKRLIVLSFCAIVGFCLVATIAFTLPSNIPNAPVPVPTPLPHLDAYKIYDLVNDFRASKGLNKLLFDPSMCDYSQKRLSEVHTDWSHRGFEINRPSYYLSKTYIGENLIKGYINNQSVVDAWIASPEHVTNIVKPVYTRTCVVSDNDDYVVQEFASY